MEIKRIGVVVKKGSNQAYALAKELLYFGEELGFNMYIEKEVADDINWDRVFALAVDSIDVILVIGGDGTLFRVLHRLGDLDVPIMTVRMGRRGFLLDVPPFEAKDRLKDLAEGKFRIVEYMRLKTEIVGRSGALPYALNDVVVQSWGPSKTKVVRLVVYVDDEPLYAIDGDGVIVSTPLGSTAYSLAAGGPIVDSELDSIVVTPLAPLQFNARSVVLHPDKEVRIRVAGGSGPAACIIDGQSVEVLRPDDIVVVRKAEKKAKLIRFSRVNTFARLRYYM